MKASPIPLFICLPAVFLVLLLPTHSLAQTNPTAPAPQAVETNPYDADTKGLPFSVPRDLRTLPEYALIVTTKGPIEVKLFRERTPISVANFHYLGNKGFYEGLLFHRYMPDFIVQGGDPLGTGKGDPGWTLPAEMDPEIRHVRGTIGWARKTEERNPERRSNGSQFYISLTPQPRLDGFYTAFGVVVNGMENAERLRVGDKILKIRFPRAESASALERR